MRLYLTALTFTAICLSSCKNLPSKENLASISTENIEQYAIQGILWQQTAGEYKALCYQAFNTAKFQLEKELENHLATEKPLAIITDIDETVLDNSPYQATQAKAGKSYSSETWTAWGNMKSAQAIPGALEFLKFAESNGVQVFYISDRYDTQTEATLENLRKAGFPNADTDHILLKQKGVDKEKRRQIVTSNYKVVLFLGDNLSDFSKIFDHQTLEDRNSFAENEKTEFGKKFIVLPNPMYGAWQTDGIYEGKYNWSPAQKDSIIRKKMNSY